MTTSALPALLPLLAASAGAGAALARRLRRPAFGPPIPGSPFAQILSDVSLLVVLLDREGRIVFANERLSQLTGWSRDELTGRDWDTTFGSGMVDCRRRLESLETAQSHTGQVENVLVTRSGDHRVVSWSDTLTVDERRPDDRHRPHRHRHHHPPPRRGPGCVPRLVRRAHGPAQPRALLRLGRSGGAREPSGTRARSPCLLIDIDNFKLVNESFGHAAADEILKQFSHRLRDAALGAELVARHTGDEFLILLADTDTPTGRRAPTTTPPTSPRWPRRSRGACATCCGSRSSAWARRST